MTNGRDLAATDLILRATAADIDKVCHTLLQGVGNGIEAAQAGLAAVKQQGVNPDGETERIQARLVAAAAQATTLLGILREQAVAVRGLIG